MKKRRESEVLSSDAQQLHQLSGIKAPSRSVLAHCKVDIMKHPRLLLLALSITVIGGCSNIRGAKLLMPEQFGLTLIEENIYIETAADNDTRAKLVEATNRAKNEIRASYGDVKSSPVIHGCISEKCYKSFGGMGSRAKIYGDYILLSPRGLNWHFLAHEWSHDEIRARLSLGAWWRLPRWFDEGLAVTISDSPEHSEAHWQFLIESEVRKPTRRELFTYKSLRQWLNAVHAFGETQNAERKARGEPEIRPVYTAAGHEVRHWFAEVGTPGLLELIDRLNEGEDFDAVYTERQTR